MFLPSYIGTMLIWGRGRWSSQEPISPAMSTWVFLFYQCTVVSTDFPGGSVLKNLHVMSEMRVQFLEWEDPLEEDMATHSSILA